MTESTQAIIDHRTEDRKQQDISNLLILGAIGVILALAVIAVPFSMIYDHFKSKIYDHFKDRRENDQEDPLIKGDDDNNGDTNQLQSFVFKGVRI